MNESKGDCRANTLSSVAEGYVFAESDCKPGSLLEPGGIFI